MKLRWAGDDRVLCGTTALDCLRYHCCVDHSAEGRRGDVDGVMKRLSETFQLDMSYATLPTLEERAAAFIKIASARRLLLSEP